MQLRLINREQKNGKTYDCYIYCNDDGVPICSDDSHSLLEIVNSQGFIQAELNLAPSETHIVKSHTVDGGACWKLLSKTQAEFNNAPNIIIVNDPEQVGGLG